VNYLDMFTLLRHQYPEVAHILSNYENMAFRAKLGFKNKCRARARFRLVISGLGFQKRSVYISEAVKEIVPHFNQLNYVENLSLIVFLLYEQVNLKLCERF